MNIEKKTEQSRTMIPKILEDIQNWLKKYEIEISEAVEGEGRGGSLKDEGSIKKALWNSPYKDRVFDEKARKCGDMTVLDYNNTDYHVVNIKTTNGKSSDNGHSKCGFVYALTDLKSNQIPGRMDLIQMNELIKSHQADIPQKDYWFLCINKKNPSEVIIRGAKQINNWVVNPNQSNILQINWKKEKICDPAERTWDEAYNVLIGGTIESIYRFWKKVPQDWKDKMKMLDTK